MANIKMNMEQMTQEAVEEADQELDLPLPRVLIWQIA